MPVANDILALNSEVFHSHLVSVDDLDVFVVGFLYFIKHKDHSDDSYYVKKYHKNSHFFFMQESFSEWHLHEIFPASDDHQELVGG